MMISCNVTAGFLLLSCAPIIIVLHEELTWLWLSSQVIIMARTF